MLAIFIFSLASPAQAPASGVIAPPAPIRGAIEARTRRYRSLIVEWEETTTWPRGSLSLVTGNLVPQKGESPAADVTTTTTHRLVLDGDLGRYKVTGEEPDPSTNKIHKFTEDSVYGGGRRYSCRFFPDGGVPSLGYVDDKKRFGAIEKGLISDILMAVRPAEPIIGIDLDLLDRLPHGTGVQDGERCDVFTYPLQGHYSAELWLRQKDRLVARFATYDDKRPMGGTTVHYEPGADGQSAPKGWEDVVRLGDPSTLIKSIKAVVTSFRPDVTIEKSEFEYEFPPGVEVTDLATGKRYLSGENGRQEKITRTVPPEQVLGYQGPGSLPTANRRGPSRSQIVVLGLSSAAIVLAGAVWLRRRAATRRV